MSETHGKNVDSLECHDVIIEITSWHVRIDGGKIPSGRYLVPTGWTSSMLTGIWEEGFPVPPIKRANTCRLACDLCDDNSSACCAFIGSRELAVSAVKPSALHITRSSSFTARELHAVTTGITHTCTYNVTRLQNTCIVWCKYRAVIIKLQFGLSVSVEYKNCTAHF